MSASNDTIPNVLQIRTGTSNTGEFVTMPRSVCQEIFDAFTVDFEARDGYGGEVVLREHAVDPVTLRHIFGAILEGDVAIGFALYETLKP